MASRVTEHYPVEIQPPDIHRYRQGNTGVDYVHVFNETVPMPFLEEVRPDVHVNGSEYGPECIEAPLVERLGGRIHIIERLPGLATSNILATVSARR